MSPEIYGVMPVTPTFYVNPPGDGEPLLNNGNTESVGVAIGEDGNIIISWEDDHPENGTVHSYEAVWTLYDKDGNRLTSPIPLASTGGETLGQQIVAPFRAFFRSDGSAVPGHTAFAPKVKANLFGPGLGFAATAYHLGHEIPELLSLNVEASEDGGVAWGDFPVLQLLTSDGRPGRLLSGVKEEDAERPGNMRIADWGYLSNGNVVIVTENQQEADLRDVYGGETEGTHALFRILNPLTGEEVKGLTNASSSGLKVQIWHGLAVTGRGFAIRMHQDVADASSDRAQARFFNNDGTPLGDNIDLGNLTGENEISKGGRGQNTGFHGNGRDTVVYANIGQNKEAVPWVTVLNEDGTLRWFRRVADDLEDFNCLRADAAVDEEGRVCVVFDPKIGSDPRLVMARVFDRNGAPLTGSFYVSETERPEQGALDSAKARVSWRNGRIAIVWESGNQPDGATKAVAARFFKAPEPFRILEVKPAEGNDGRVTVTWTSALGNRYAVDASPDLSTWTELQTNITGPDHTITWRDESPLPPGEKRFYRVRLLP